MALAWTASATALCQLSDYQLNRIQEEAGLKTFDILNIAKDKNGFLWLASQSHVQQFDGRHNLSYPFNETVNRVFIDKQNRKWVLTRGGVFLFIGNHQGFQQITGNELTSNLYQTIDGKICMMGGGKHYVFDESKKQFVEFSSSVAAQRYLGQYDNTLFFANRDSVVAYHQDTKNIASMYAGNINVAVPLGNDEIMISSPRFKTFYLNLATKDNHEIGDELLVKSGVRLQNGQCLLSSNKGFFQYDTRTQNITYPVFYFAGRPLENQQSTTVMYKDDDGRIYLNHADGLFFMGGKPDLIHYFRNYSWGKEQMLSNDIRNFAEDEDGNIWMATSEGIARLNMQTGELKTFDPLNSRSIIDFPSYRQLLNDGNYLWIGTSGTGVWLYDKRTGTTKRPVMGRNEKEFTNSYVWKIIKLNDGRLLVVCGSALFIIDRNTLVTGSVPFPRGAGISRSALQDSSGRIWHGTTGGLLCYDTSFNVLFRVKDSFPDKRVASFCEWKKNTMLIGSKGLFQAEISGNKIVSFKRMKAISQDLLVYCMKQDRQGFVWLGTNDGLLRFDPEKDEAILLDRSDHVQSQAFNSDGAFMSRSGMLFMGGKNGVNYFDPSKFSADPEVLRPQVFSFAVNIGDSVYYNPDHAIPYNSRDVDFIISAPDFKKPFRIRYRYRLRQNHQQWNYTGFNNTVSITKLQPGDYALQVSASYDGINWFDSAATYDFTVLKPWWQTWWFRALCALALALAAWALWRYRQKKKEAAEIKRAIEYFTYSGSADTSAPLILWDIARNCISRLGFEDCVIYLLDERRNVLVQKAAYGAKNPNAFEIANPIEIPVGKGITGQVAKTKRSLIVNDTSKDQRYIVDDERRYSELTVPIIHDGKLIGVIDSENRRKNFFTRHHLKTLETISSLCASKIATAVALEAARKAESELLTLNGKMMESKFTNLRLQMNPHFLFNILTTIQYLIVSNQVNKATRYVDIFAGFLRSLLSYAEATVVTLEEELRILTMYVELESLCLDETFIWEVNVDEDIDKDEVLVPFMLLQPFVENAINHGLIHKIGEKRFSITIKEHDADSLVCIIEDNGIGRTASAVINNKKLSRVLHESKGIGIVEQRLELLQQKTSKEACFEIEDLYKNGAAAGTRVSIIVPYYSNEDV